MKTTVESKSALSAEGLSLGYERKGKRAEAYEISRGLNLELKAGEFVCLLGPNGVGKSTLIRSLCGMQKPLAGSIRIGDTDINEMTPKQRARTISVVLTEGMPSGMFDGYSVAALGRHPHTRWNGALDRQDRDRIEWALRAVGATHLSTRQVTEMSDGERQKIMITRALAQEAGIMLLDEPTAFLDLPRRVELMRTLRNLAREEGLAVLLSTHDLDLALRGADRLWLFGVGGQVQTGMPEELALSGAIAQAFASQEVDWDSEHGSFRMHQNPCVKIALVGNGERAIWTKRALARIGYEVVAEGEGAVATIVVSQGTGEKIWRIESADTDMRFQELSDLVRYLLER